VIEENDGPLAPQILLLLVVVAVFIGIGFAMWLFGVMTTPA
jgi:hypothetical protein